VILADTSAWVEYLRATGSPTHLRLRELIAADGELATTEVVTMELLAGVAAAEEVTRLRRLLLRFQLLPIGGLADYEAAAALYRHCRARGETVRSTVRLSDRGRRHAPPGDPSPPRPRLRGHRQAHPTQHGWGRSVSTSTAKPRNWSDSRMPRP
jgi:predicted nucleic acid-binding protein